MKKAPPELRAKQRSEVVTLILSPKTNGSHCWHFVVTSQGGTQWSRPYKTREAAVRAAIKQGFKVRQ